jgi:hypothetical protein
MYSKLDEKDKDGLRRQQEILTYSAQKKAADTLKVAGNILNSP